MDMTIKPSSKKMKSLRIGFYTSSDATKKNSDSLVPSAFEKLFNDCGVIDGKYKTFNNGDRNLKVTTILKDNDACFYYGFMSITRNSAHLAYIADVDWKEEKIPLSPTQQLSERAYFLYYYNTDILILSQNHLGPKATDLSYVLFCESGAASPVSFSAIWKEESIKELFETGTILKTCELTIAAPRDFNKTSYNMQNQLSKQVVDMMSGSGSSHLDIILRGESSSVDTGFEWLSEDVKKSLKELLEKFTGDNKAPNIKKADVIRKGQNRKTSLVDQVLIHTKNVRLQSDGYPDDLDVKNILIQSRLENKKYLVQYEVKTSFSE